MWGRRRMPVLMLLTLGCWALMASAATAKAPTHLLNFRPCNSVLVSADFYDDLEEVSPTRTTGSFSTSICKYAGTTQADSAGGLKSFTKGELGVECLANSLRQIEAGDASPAASCYRIATVSVLFLTGAFARKELPKLVKGAKRRVWPSGFTRHALHGLGNDAEFGYDGSKGFGYLQVVNASVEVEVNEPLSMITLLRDAATVL